MLVPTVSSHKVISVYTDRSVAIASHHFPVVAVLEFALSRNARSKTSKPNANLTALKDPSVKSKVVNDFVERVTAPMETTIDDRWQAMCRSMQKAVQDHVPKSSMTARAPSKVWISAETLALIDERDTARHSADFAVELTLRKQVKQSAKRDRARWLEDIAASGDWNAIRKTKKPCKISQSRLRGEHGTPVSTDVRAETFSEYLERVQWYVRPVQLIPGTLPQIYPTLNMNDAPFSHPELRKAIRGLKSGKATQENDIPIEFFKALAASPGSALDPFLDLCNDCLSSSAVPQAWLHARVAMVFKKGDPALCENYRPICVLLIAYKILASMLRQRLLDAGIEQRLWETQYGFIELACAQRQGRVSLLALDWRKAFDWINVQSLLDALRRLGLPAHFVNLVAPIMDGRCFHVRDFGAGSSAKPQLSGISQGCTLSPLLFIIVMTVLMHDAVELLGPQARAAYEQGGLADLAYADDTLLLGLSSAHLAEYLQAVASAGMELHNGKLQLINICCTGTVPKPDGEPLAPQASMEYLGTILSENGRLTSELSRRIGQARREFRSLCQVWRHSALSVKRKLHIFDSLVQSKFLYGLAACCCTVAEQRRVNGFQAKCGRQILGITPSYWSRVSNVEVLRRAGMEKATDLL